MLDDDSDEIDIERPAFIGVVPSGIPMNSAPCEFRVDGGRAAFVAGEGADDMLPVDSGDTDAVATTEFELGIADDGACFGIIIGGALLRQLTRVRLQESISIFIHHIQQNQKLTNN